MTLPNSPSPRLSSSLIFSREISHLGSGCNMTKDSQLRQESGWNWRLSNPSVLHLEHCRWAWLTNHYCRMKQDQWFAHCAPQNSLRAQHSMRARFLRTSFCHYVICVCANNKQWWWRQRSPSFQQELWPVISGSCGHKAGGGLRRALRMRKWGHNWRG